MPHRPWHPKASHVMKYPLADASEAENHETPQKRERIYLEDSSTIVVKFL